MKNCLGGCCNQRPLLKLCRKKPLVFSAANSARLAASLERGEFPRTATSGILAQIFWLVRKSSAAYSGTLRFKTRKKNSVKYRLYNCRANCADGRFAIKRAGCTLPDAMKFLGQFTPPRSEFCARIRERKKRATRAVSSDRWRLVCPTEVAHLYFLFHSVAFCS